MKDMRREIKKFEIRCDGPLCRNTVLIEGTNKEHEKPAGWGSVNVGPCGLTGYYRDELFCPDCLAKHEKEQERA